MDRSLYKISNVNQMDPFLMTITSGSDHWMYLSSTGCLTAGRVKAEYTLFPYVTDDLLHRNAHFTGPVTILRIQQDSKNYIWEPFSKHKQPFNRENNLYKNSLGDTVVFEEKNHTLGLTYSYKWQASAEYGFVRKSSLINFGEKSLQVELLDGLRNIMPDGVELRTQQEMSNLANAYKVSEYMPDANCALFFMNALLMDRPEPGESLYTNLVWSCYNGKKNISLSEEDIARFKDNGAFSEAHLVKGKPGSFLTKIEKKLEPGSEIHWYTVADVHQSQSEVTHLISDLNDASKIELKLEESIQKNHLLLQSAIGSADGFQCTNETINDLHHTANTLFNVLRGGVFLNNYDLRTEDFLKFLSIRNTEIFDQYRDKIKAFPENIGLRELIDFGDETKEPSLRRLCREYLPLTLGRRHGDPSRPWNRFEIRIKDENGNPLLYYEGNWRDIFQNWEALGYSYPQTWESMVCTFINATSMDGYNPYRVTSEGIDWEVSDPDDPWSYIGYWNDHQIIYLLKLMEHLYNHDPSAIKQLLKEQLFSYSNIPHRLRTFDQIVENPKETIDFDFEGNAAIQDLVKNMGNDGKLILNENQTVYHVTMCEKLLVLSMAKICNYIPGAGIWLNTQRPEWNDANNALVGNGASMVTVYYLRRFLAFFSDLLGEMDFDTVPMSVEVCAWFNAAKGIVMNWTKSKDLGSITNKDRMEYVTKLGKVFEEYRNTVYNKGFSGTEDISLNQISEFIFAINNDLETTISSSKNANGLYHAYNTIQIDLKKQSMDVQHLDLMLEGQVAALSSGLLKTDDAIEVLDTLSVSELYRESMRSFMLYPIKKVIPYLEKNIIQPHSIAKSKLLSTMLQNKDFTLIEQDADDQFRFKPQFRNSFDLQAALHQILDKKDYKDLVDQENDLVLEIFEEVFDHRNFTGRSGTMFSYEGIGSIYWHMISKLLLAVQENYFKAVRTNVSSEKMKKLGQVYYDIRGGLSAAKTPEEYGAFPYDPYSHTPNHSGAQQPGMTGQVKEEILTRFGELGCTVAHGCIRFEPYLLKRSEFLTTEQVFKYYDVFHQKRKLTILENQLAYTFCQVPVIYTLSDKDNHILLELSDGSKVELDGNVLDEKQSNLIFNRDGKTAQIKVFMNNNILFNR